DPLGAGFVTSLSRPSGNLTGVSLMTLSEKWPELARELLPAVKRIGYLWNPNDARSTVSFSQARRSTEALGLEFGSYPVERPENLDSAFTAMMGDGVSVLLLDPAHPSPTNWPVVAQLALKHRLPRHLGTARFRGCRRPHVLRRERIRQYAPHGSLHGQNP